MRSGVAVEIITRVMTVESAGAPGAVSPKGAIGCMQIMPATWAYLTQRYGLGSDPFDPRMNMIGGALYLAELIRAFGLPGAYAAYNAGPGRYIRHVANGIALPTETVIYTARVAGTVPRPSNEPVVQRWQNASLFLSRGNDDRTSTAVVTRRTSATTSDAVSLPPQSEQVRQPRTVATLFPLASDATLGRQ